MLISNKEVTHWTRQWRMKKWHKKSDINNALSIRLCLGTPERYPGSNWSSNIWTKILFTFLKSKYSKDSKRKYSINFDNASWSHRRKCVTIHFPILRLLILKFQKSTSSNLFDIANQMSNKHRTWMSPKWNSWSSPRSQSSSSLTFSPWLTALAAT